MKMISDTVLYFLALAVSACAAALGGVLYLASHSIAFLLPLPLLLAAWLAHYLVSPGAQRPDARRRIGEAIFIAGLLLCLTLVSRTQALSGEVLRERGLGFLMGVIVVVFANVVPKQAGSVLGMGIRRMTGWSLVLAGIGYCAAWLFLPLAWAGTAALAMLLCATVFALARTAWLLMKQRRIPPSQTG
jgi:hypothetical protein